ncbi:COP9 signalosome complex subunit 1 isoform X4 [Hydra vulgaris]|uniref:COP9 signalosome complex subunit 1 isoform X4 n=1 Tax=Hydra vulgaris TaxID=6087 RepID=A0ABM4CDE6_HYDVU
MSEPMQVDFVDNESINRDESFIVENPSLDLDSYASCYVGLAKLQRLIFIAKHCPSYAVDSLRTAASTVKTTHYTDMYRDIMLKLNEAMSHDHSDSRKHFELDGQWIETTNKKAQIKFDKLDQDLKTYKNNSIKESIRRGHDDLGDHCLDCGDLSNALKSYSRARDYSTCAQHTINMCLNVIKVSILMQNWAHVQTFVRKAEAIPELFECPTATNANIEKQKKANAVVIAKLKVALGLAELSQKQYKSAACSFLGVSFDHLDFSEIISAQDVAIYGGLCALATFDREELHKRVLSSSSFKQFLELQPQLREVLLKFYSSKYATCLDLLDKMRDNLMLDIYLYQHVNKLYTQIRNRALVQYFNPYVVADLHKMAASFNTSVESLEDELTQLILDSQIMARIDSSKKVLYARDVDHRRSTYDKVILCGKEYEKRTKALILRTVVLQHQIQVKSARDDDAAR